MEKKVEKNKAATARIFSFKVLSNLVALSEFDKMPKWRSDFCKKITSFRSNFVQKDAKSTFIEFHFECPCQFGTLKIA